MKALIDGDPIVYAVGFSVDDLDEDMVIQEIIDRVQLYFIKIMNETGADSYDIYLSGGLNFRDELATLQPYKGNRDKKKRPKYFAWIRSYLKHVYAATIVDFMEADDALGIAACTADTETIICTVDKDLDMIPGKHYNWRKNTVYDVKPIDAWRFFYLQLITGDRVDNIPGLYKQLLLAGRTEDAKKLRSKHYIKRATKMLGRLSSPERMDRYVVRLYGLLGLSENLQEIVNLIWIKREAIDE